MPKEKSKYPMWVILLVLVGITFIPGGLIL